MKVEITKQPLDPWRTVREYQEQAGFAGQYGATAVFIGTMRDFNEGDDVHAMHLEHYPGMTENYLDKILQHANSEWDLLDCLVQHRVGELKPNDPIVVVAVWSAHRKDAFDASRYIMEELKSRAPFWKKETLTDGERWVEKNTAG